MKNKKVKIIQMGTKENKNIKMLDYNRPIDRSLVNKLKVSMEKYGILSAITVYENKNEILVVDGQHRWTAASELGLTIPAISIGWDAMSAMVEMNTIQVNWNVENFVNFFSAHTNPEISESYKFLKRKKEEYPDLAYSSLGKIFGKPSSAPSIKQGKWALVDERKGDKLIKQLDSLKEYIPYVTSTRFLIAYVDVAYHPEYKHKRMLSKIKRDANISLVTSSNPNTYGRMLTRIYNYGMKKDLVMFKACWV